MRLAFAYGLGTFLLVAELIRDRRRVAQASVDALVPMLCGIPLVLLVVGVGETPRHYIAELALVILTGTIGWYHGLIRLRERDRFTAVLFSVLVALAVVILARRPSSGSPRRSSSPASRAWSSSPSRRR